MEYLKEFIVFVVGAACGFSLAWWVYCASPAAKRFKKSLERFEEKRTQIEKEYAEFSRRFHS